MSALRWAERALCARYQRDARGRLLHERAPAVGAAPRLVFTRTPLGNLWWLRADLSAALVRRLATLAAREDALPRGAIDAGAPGEPERAVFLERALAEEGPVEARSAGAVLAATGPRPPSSPSGASGVALREPDEQERSELARTLAATGRGAEGVPHPVAGAAVRSDGDGPWGRGGLVRVALRADRPVAAAWCSHGDGRGPSIVRVETLAGERGRGYGVAVGLALCEAVRGRGGEPYASVAWRDAAGFALARRLGLEPIGDERSWR